MRADPVLRWAIALLAGILLAACAQPIDLEIAITPRPTVEPGPAQPISTLEPPPPTLIVCLGQEPESLYRYSAEYLYGGTGRAAETVLQAIYDGPFDIRNYRLEPVILTKMPDLADGDARLENVAVDEGDLYFNPHSLQPATLTRGDQYLPAGCNSPDCLRTYSSGTVSMDRMVVDFQLKPGLVWSDGEPLTAADSVFSYELDRDVDSPTPKTQVDRTAGYAALDPLTVRWTGVPGYIDSEYASNFWSPLPQHSFGEEEAAELLGSEATGRTPLGWGPYVIDEWRPGQDLRLTSNPAYFRSPEALPAYEVLVFRFLAEGSSSSVEQLLTSECDVLDESAIADTLDVELLDEAALATLVALKQEGRIGLAGQTGVEIERLDFGLEPVPAAGLPPLFSDVRTRAAIAACLDREGFVAETLIGLSAVPNTYLSPDHPLYATEVGSIEYDPLQAGQLLEEVGWLDADGDPATPRVAQGVPGVPSGTELAFTWITTPDGFHRAAAAHFAANLAECGVAVAAEFLQAEELFAPWPDGPGFGRKFQTVGWAWPGWVSPLCEMFASWEIPTDDNPFGANPAGLQDPEFDSACFVLLHAQPGSAEYLEAVGQTQARFAATLPAIPLYVRPRLIAFRPGVCGVEVDPTAFSALWNLEEIRPCG